MKFLNQKSIMRNTGYLLNSFLSRTSLNRNSNTEIQNAIRNCSNGFVLSNIYKIRENKDIGAREE